jgi:hypothetical protein
MQRSEIYQPKIMLHTAEMKFSDVSKRRLLRTNFLTSTILSLNGQSIGPICVAAPSKDMGRVSEAM